MTIPLRHEALARAQGARGTVHVVEDEDSVRRSLLLLLGLQGYAATGFASAEEFLERVPHERPACALVDVCLPGISGLVLQERMARARHAPPVLLMSGHGDFAMARAALLQGASDFLEKPVEEEDLIAAVDDALQADAQRLDGMREDARLLARLASLTGDERALFDAITDGQQTRAIAERLGVSVCRIELQRAALLQKLQIRRLAHLLRLRFRADACAAQYG